MLIDAETYFSPELESEYLTNSQFKAWKKCPAAWKAKLDGEYSPDDPVAFLHGTYVDMALTEPQHVFDHWVESNRERIIGKRGKYAAFLKLDEAIEVVRSEKVMMEYLKGQGQVAIASDDFNGQGLKVKMKLDVLNIDKGFITDLKTSASVNEGIWINIDKKRKQVPFIDAFDYWTQLGIYQHGVYEEYGERYPCYIVAVEKEPPYDRNVFDLSAKGQDCLQDFMEVACQGFREMQAIKDDNLPASMLDRCNACSYCIETKRITQPKAVTPYLLPF